jgi:chromosome segregation ATPase
LPSPLSLIVDSHSHSLTHTHVHHITEEKLAESTSANSALSSQLENIAPQLTQLETSLTESRHKLKQEQKLRRQAEQAQDDAEVRHREMEQSLTGIREECDVVHEELAFKENELEETRLELEVEKQQLQNELAAVRAALDTAENAAMNSSDAVVGNRGEGQALADEVSEQATASQMTAADSVPSVDDGYVKKLEEELELVTEQLIETEKRLSEQESHVQSLQTTVETLQTQQGGRSDEDVDLIMQLQSENADNMDTIQRLRDDLDIAKEELVLTKEEVTLQQEELQALESEVKAAAAAWEEEHALRKEETTQLTIRVKEAEVASKVSLGEAALVASTITEAGQENIQMQEEIMALEAALKNAQEDYKNVLDELDAVNGRFDEARVEAEEVGRDAAKEEMRAAMKTDVAHEVQEMKDQLAKLSEENSTLQQKVDDAEMAMAALKDNQDRDVEGAEAHSEVAKQLQLQLARAKEDLSKKDTEMEAIANRLEERVVKAEENVTKLEGELHVAKGQLAESEAHLIVLRRENERNSSSLAKTPMRKEHGSSASPRTLSRSGSNDREELSCMESQPSPQNLRSPGRHRSRSTSPSSVMKWEFRLAEESKKYQELEKSYDSLRDQKRMGEIRIKRLEDDLRTLQKELFSNGGDTAVVTQMTRLSSLGGTEKAVDIIAEDEIQGKRVLDIIESRDPKLMAEELKSLEKKCNGQREYNAQLLSKMLHLQGNIQVYCRLRPMTITEVQNGYKSVCESLSETEVGCFDARTNKWKSFAFDRVWGPDQSQQSVFQDVEPLALSVVDGYNACIFAYGQTGSGKTFTMEGSQENNQYGISYRTIQKIFHLLKLRAQQQRAAEMFVGSENEDEPSKEVAFTFSLQLGMLEIYNDEIYDLLNTAGSSVAEKKEGAMKAGGKTSLEIRRNKEGRVEVPDLTKEKVDSIQGVMDLLKRGNSNRATATTDMNEHSSRSHMVLMVDVHSGLNDTTPSNKGTLYLVDLAGSERVRKSNVEGDQLKEAGFINKSLSALGNVMEALDRKASHIPFRDSKLTYMLQDSLGGNSRTMMVVTVNPVDNSYDESVHALQFATRVRRIQIGAAKRNVTSKNLEETVKALTDEMRSLTRAKERTESQLHSLKRDNTRVQDKLQNLSKSRTQSRSDTKTLDMLRKNNDDMAARWKKEKTAREEAAEELEKASKELRSVQQQLGKANSKMKDLEQKFKDNEQELELAGKELRQQKTDSSAATLRSRRAQVLSSRRREPAATSKSLAVSSSPKSPDPKPATTVPETATPSADASEDIVTEELSVEVTMIRSKVLELLKKHDEGKVNRIDIIMDKFKGKEALLLEKMTQRYEQGSDTLSISVQKRNEVALERHRVRMEKIRENREKKVHNGAGSMGSM